MINCEGESFDVCDGNDLHYRFMPGSAPAGGKILRSLSLRYAKALYPKRLQPKERP